MASNCSRGGADKILAKISSQEERCCSGIGCTGRWCSHCDSMRFCDYEKVGVLPRKKCPIYVGSDTMGYPLLSLTSPSTSALQEKYGGGHFGHTFKCIQACSFWGAGRRDKSIGLNAARKSLRRNGAAEHG